MTSLLDANSTIRPGGLVGGRLDRRLSSHRLRVDAMDVLGTSFVAAAIACYLADRSEYGWNTVPKALTSLGVIAGLIAMSVMILQFLLVARIPWVDQVVGHDRAIERHKGLNTLMMTSLVLHIWFLVLAWAIPSHSLFTAIADMWSVDDIALSIIGMGMFVVVGLTSWAIVRSRLPRELWHAVHLTTYAAVALSIPHQFSQGGIFAEGASRIFWAMAITVTAAALVSFRVVRPIVNSIDHSVVVTEVRPASRDSVEIIMEGRRLDQLDIQPGQFANWRFWTPGLFAQPHPFSFSSAPDGKRLAITVRNLGKGSAAIARLRPGTRVSFEGPFGRFTPASRTRPGLVLAGAGVGIAPLVALLEGMEIIPGMATVIIRGRDADEVPHLARIQELCRVRGVRFVPLLGHRAASGWSSAQYPGLRLSDVAPWIGQADIYACGPEVWTAALLEDARTAGLSDDQLHDERFSW